MQLFVENLTNVDFSYLCPERGLIGETWLANITLDGPLDEQGMICDFGIVKKHIRRWLDTEIDHRLAIPTESANLKASEYDNKLELEFHFGVQQKLHCQSPISSIAQVNGETITPASVAKWCIAGIKTQLPDSIDRIQLEFIPEDISSPYYHYSHGLKKHNGNCQRIAHGHRSKILIWRNNALDHIAINRWASTFRDIYIGTREDIIAEDQDSYTFEYQAQQGYFKLKMPKQCCYIFETDTTVEFIAHHIADVEKSTFPQDAIRVKAFEGIGKGAIVERL